jgi:AraC-like DNA-binding protein
MKDAKQLYHGYVSYSDLVDGRRCKAACEALEHTQQSIKDIAAALGYSDPTHFSRAFRRIAGLNPRQYRQAYSQCFSKDAPVADSFVDLSHTGH